jgi:hypothetical protein
MISGNVKGKVRKAIKYIFFFSLLLFFVLLLFANRFVEPILRQRLHTLIIQGSDSLYSYQLGDLNANFFGGNVEVENLHIRIDSNHFRKLFNANALPALTMQLDLQSGRIKGLSVFALLFSKKIEIKDIISQEANVRLSRHVRNNYEPANTTPLWKALQPAIKSISIDRINLDGVKLLYKNADTSESVKLQFDRCEALFQNIKIDSAAEADGNRVAFAKNMFMQFYDLKFRTPDSSYKMKAEIIRYSSANRLLEVMDFKVQSTLEKEAFFKAAAFQESHYEIDFKEAGFTNFQLGQFINNNVVAADSIVIKQPQALIAVDKTLPLSTESKFGKYPHQLLQKADAVFRIKGIRIEDGNVRYTERGQKTGREGTLEFSNANLRISNVTNDSAWINRNKECTVIASANVFGTSPLQAKFVFHLNDEEGAFDVTGEARDINAVQLNSVAEPLGNAKLQSLHISIMSFQIHGDGYSTKGNVQMKYNDLAITLRKTDEETGAVKTKKFLSKILNKFSIYPDNPGNGVERVATDVVYARLSTKGFFGVVWKTIFAGMQNIMMKSGHYE